MGLVIRYYDGGVWLEGDALLLCFITLGNNGVGFLMS
jgi:hypothetical protein